MRPHCKKSSVGNNREKVKGRQGEERKEREQDQENHLNLRRGIIEFSSGEVSLAWARGGSKPARGGFRKKKYLKKNRGHNQLILSRSKLANMVNLIGGGGKFEEGEELIGIHRGGGERGAVINTRDCK